MQCRWMLAFEEEDGALSLLKVAPRAWLRAGQRIAVKGFHTLFGKLDYEVVATDTQIRATVRLEDTPREIRLRLPHPEGKHPRAITGGTYDLATETVIFTGNAAEVTLEF